MLSLLVFCSVISDFVFVSIDICFEQLLIFLLLVFMSVLRTHSFFLSIYISFLEVINFLFMELTFIVSNKQ